MKTFLPFVVLVLFLISCSPADQGQAPAPAVEPAVVPPQEPEAKPVPVFDDGTAERLAREQQQRIIEIIEHPPKVPVRERKTVVTNMWDTFMEIDSYQFKTPQGIWFVLDDKIKYIPFNPIAKFNVESNGKLYRQVYIDEVYFDRAAKTAQGYCVGHTEQVGRHCVSLKLTDIPFPITYGDHIIKLPEEWVQQYFNENPTNEEDEKYYIEGRLTIRVQFKDNTTIYFFPQAGLPVRIVPFGKELAKIVFDGIVVDQVRPEDVRYRSRREIPAEEYFYKPRYY